MRVVIREIIEHTVEVPTERGSQAAEQARVNETSILHAAKSVAVQWLAGAPGYTGVHVVGTVIKSRIAVSQKTEVKE